MTSSSLCLPLSTASVKRGRSKTFHRQQASLMGIIQESGQDSSLSQMEMGPSL